MFEVKLKAWAADRGYGLAIADIGVVGVVRKKLEERRDAGLIEASFFDENLSKFRFLEGIDIPGPKRVIMVAIPSPVSVVPLKLGGRTIETLIPPTYVRYLETFERVLEDMKATALGEAAAAETLRAPLKSLAVHMGLVRYGRNNITYARGLGSGFQLCGYVVGTEARAVEMSAPATKSEVVLERCGRCTACVKVCPTGAIREDRFLIRAERCFTLHSERQDPMPAWAARPKEICLIGCMDCQRICAENKDMLRTEPSGIELSAEETEAILEVGRALMRTGALPERGARAAAGSAYASARAKLDRLGMSEDTDLLGRNLGFYLEGNT